MLNRGRFVAHRGDEHIVGVGFDYRFETEFAGQLAPLVGDVVYSQLVKHRAGEIVCRGLGFGRAVGAARADKQYIRRVGRLEVFADRVEQHVDFVCYICTIQRVILGRAGDITADFQHVKVVVETFDAEQRGRYTGVAAEADRVYLSGIVGRSDYKIRLG